MKEHENILIFSKGTHNYYPIKEPRKGNGDDHYAQLTFGVESHHYCSSGTMGENLSNKNYVKIAKPLESYGRLRNPSSVQYFKIIEVQQA